jgi:hypothetical protein
MADKKGSEKPYEYLIDQYKKLLGHKQSLEGFDKQTDLDQLNKDLLNLNRPSSMKGDEFRPVVILNWKRGEFLKKLEIFDANYRNYKNTTGYTQLDETGRKEFDAKVKELDVKTLQEFGKTQTSPGTIDRRIRALAVEIEYISDAVTNNGRRWTNELEAQFDRLWKVQEGLYDLSEKYPFDSLQKTQLRRLWNQLNTLKDGDLLDNGETRSYVDETIANIHQRMVTLSDRVLENDPVNGGFWKSANIAELESILERYNALQSDASFDGYLTREQMGSLNFINEEIKNKLIPWKNGEGGEPVEADSSKKLESVQSGNSRIAALEAKIVALSESMRAKDPKHEKAWEEADVKKLDALKGKYNAMVAEDEQPHLTKEQITALGYIQYQLHVQLTPWSKGEKNTDGTPKGYHVNEKGLEELSYYLQGKTPPDRVKQKGFTPQTPTGDGQNGGGQGDDSRKKDDNQGGGQTTDLEKRQRAAGGRGGRGGPRADDDDTTDADGNILERAFNLGSGAGRSLARKLDVSPDSTADQYIDAGLDLGGDFLSKTAGALSAGFNKHKKTPEGRGWIAAGAGVLGAIMLPARIQSLLEAQLPGYKWASDNLPLFKTAMACVFMFFGFKGVRKLTHVFMGGNEGYVDEAAVGDTLEAAGYDRTRGMDGSGNLAEWQKHKQEVQDALSKFATKEQMDRANKIIEQMEKEKGLREEAEQKLQESESKRKEAEAKAEEAQRKLDQKRLIGPPEDPQEEGKGARGIGSSPVNFAGSMIPAGILLKGLIGFGADGHKTQHPIPGQGDNRFVDGGRVSGLGNNTILENVPSGRVAVASNMKLFSIPEIHRSNTGVKPESRYDENGLHIG